MVSIQEKINIFKQELQLSIDRKRKEEVTEAIVKSTEKYQQAEKKLEEELKQIRQKYERLEDRRVNKLITEGTSGQKEILQNLRREVKENFFETVKIEAYNFLNSDSYYLYYVKSLNELSDYINDTDSIIFHTRKEDRERFEPQIYEILGDINIHFKELDVKEIGGFTAVDKNERFKFDFTILDLLEENRKQIDFYLKQALSR